MTGKEAIQENSQGGRSRQPEFFPRSKRPIVPIEENHRLVVLAEKIDWTELEEWVQHIRLSKLKNAAGRPPHLRALIGALLLRATRDMTWREAEDLVRHYAPARYLCGLTETEWSPDYRTLHDFAVLLGEEGTRLLNEYVVKWAVKEKLTDPSVVVADTTAQEAAIPYPNEMGLMATFMTALAASSKKAGDILAEFGEKTASQFKTAKEKVRQYRLFAKTKEQKDKMVAEMASLVEEVQTQLGQALERAVSLPQKLKKHGVVARAKIEELHETMKKLIPQIRHWLETGRVAADKIVSIHIPELYAIVRGKTGKAVEFGLKWGFTRLRGGFLIATLAQNKHEMVDTKFAVQAVEDHIVMFGEAPQAYAYDRGGYSEKNVAALAALGVEEVGLAPRGQTEWAVDAPMKQELIRERALIEGGIGTTKSRRYGFNRPRTRSKEMMGSSGQLAVLGFNLNKLIRGLAARDKVQVVG